MAVDYDQSNQISILINYLDSFVTILDGEAAIPAVDRQLSSDNIDHINATIETVLDQIDGLLAPAP